MGVARHVMAVLASAVLAAVIAVLGHLLVPGWWWLPAVAVCAAMALLGLEVLAVVAARRRRSAVRLAVAGVVVFSLLAGGLALGAGKAVQAVRSGGQGPLTRVRVTAAMADGGRPDPSTMERTRKILLRRLSAAGLRGATVQVERGLSGLVIELRTRTPGLVRQLVGTGMLRFRQVVNSVRDGSASSSPTTPPTSQAGVPPSLAGVQAKLGAAYQLAAQLTGPSDAQQLGTDLDPFAKLTPAEVSVLPTSMQLDVPQVGCQQLGNRPAGSIDAVNQQVVACGDGYKYLLDRASVVGTDVKSASYLNDATQNGWKVTLTFKGSGQDKWTSLTKKAYGQTAPADQVAITLDDDVVSAPAIQSVITGDAEITGSFTQNQARALAADLNTGALPLTLTVQSIAVTHTD